MSWVKEDCLSPFQQFCIEIVKQGRIPRHIAFIMDGNRRYYESLNLERLKGLKKGFEKLSEATKWCLELGVREMTMYCFSIDNFARKEDEVAAIMFMALVKIKSLLDEMDKINRCGIQVRVVGRLSLLTKELQEKIAEAVLATKDNKTLVLNLAFAYTGRDEISRTASRIIGRVKKNEINPKDIDEHLVTENLDLSETDLLIRTSGEGRLSDFMLWQVSNSVLYFEDKLWPTFTIWDMLKAIIHFQRYAVKPKLEDGNINRRDLNFELPNEKV